MPEIEKLRHPNAPPVRIQTLKLLQSRYLAAVGNVLRLAHVGDGRLLRDEHPRHS